LGGVTYLHDIIKGEGLEEKKDDSNITATSDCGRKAVTILT
jgi:hypothetical protein